MSTTAQTAHNLLASHHSKYDIEYNTYFSNHLPHAIIALYHLNASPERIQAFAAKYGSNLDPPRHDDISPAHMYDDDDKTAVVGDKTGKITDENFRWHLGKRRYFQQYFKFFQNKMGKDPTEKHRDEIVARYFPILSHGSLHSALHPLIHLGWSLSLPSSISTETTIEGLAYCAFANFAYDKQPTKDDTKIGGSTNLSQRTPIQTLIHSHSQLSGRVGEMENGILKVPYQEMNIGEFQRCMVFISQHYGHFISSCCRQLAVPSTRAGMLSMLNDLLDVALLTYAASDNDFFVLHVCTALMGAIHIAPRLEDACIEDTIRLMTFGWIMVWLAQKYNGADHAFIQQLSKCNSAEEEKEALVRINDELKRETDKLDWSQIIQDTIQVDDEHTMKLVHVCQYRDQHEGPFKALYKYVANKRLKHTEKGESY